jgi:hypothetical protein
MGRTRSLIFRCLCAALLLGWCAAAPAQPPQSIMAGRPLVMLRPVVLQPPHGGLDAELGLLPPTPEELFRAESESQFRNRLRQEAQAQKKPLTFPREPLFSQPPATALVRPMPAQVAASVPGVVCHPPLYFGDHAAERYGWFVPCVQPVLSTGAFYVDTLLLPYRMVVRPPWTCECGD